MTPKKIVIIGPAHPLRGGLATFNERLARQFIAEGHEVMIYTFSLQYPKFFFPGTTQYSDAPAPQDLSIFVEINSVWPPSWISAGNEIKKLRPDLIVVRYWLPVMGPSLGTILRIAKRNSHTEVVCIADNISPHEKRKGDKAFTKYFIRPVDRFVVMSEKVKSDLKKFDADKPAILVQHPLYDNFGEKIDKLTAAQELSLEDSFKYLLFFGFIRKYKGLDILFDAIKILAGENFFTDKRVLVAGEFYEDRKGFDVQINELGIEKFLVLKTDFIPDAEVRNYFCVSDVVIQPYRNATQSGVTPLAYHFEIPMIVTNVGGLPALVPHGIVGLVAEPNAESLAEKIREYFRLGKQHFIPGLQAEKKKFSWENMTTAILQSENAGVK